MNNVYRALPVVAQNVACTWAGWRRARTRFTPFFFSTLESWERSVSGPLERLHEIQRERLDRLVTRAREHVPFYRSLPPCSDHEDDAEAIHRTLSGIPPLDKATYRDRHREFLADDVSTSRLIKVSTSGTTGSALPLWLTPERVAEGYAAVWRQRRACGLQIDDPQMTFAGQVIVPLRQRKPPFWRWNAYGKQTLFSVYHMSARNLPAYVDAIQRTPARYVQGYPSALHLVGRSLLDAGRPLEPGRITAVFSSSESLLAFQREAIEAGFGAPVRDHYAATELVVSMTACAQNRLHVDMEFCIVEVEVEEETDEYVRGPLLVTGLGNDAAPMFRYRIGDVGTRSKSPCPCGRPGDNYLEIDGRVEDYVITPDGRMVGRLDHIFKEQYDIAEAQIVQDTKEAITVFVTPRATYSAASQKRLLAEIRSRLGDEIRVDVRLTDAIPRESNGKFRAVKSRVGPSAA
jgi:phenylacetate-CoA ligase